MSRARRRIADSRARFLLADLFSWTPDRRYDVVFFGFWLSHVPLDRFAWFWTLIAACLEPAGRVFFVDDAFRAADELIEGPASSTIRRRLNDGSSYRIVKVPHETAELEARLRDLGWDIAVHSTRGPFYWGAGTRSQGSSPIARFWRGSGAAWVEQSRAQVRWRSTGWAAQSPSRPRLRPRLGG